MRGDRSRADGGFTLVEVVVAMMTFAVLVTLALGLIVRITHGVRTNDARVAASALAGRQIEAVRGTAVGDIPDGRQISTTVVGGTTYTVRQNASLVAAGSTGGLCTSTGGELAYKLVTVTVTWPDMGVTSPVRADTLKAIGTNVLDPAKGTLAVKVSRADASAAEGVAVTLTPGGAQVTTGDDGCAVFSQLAAGTYQVRLDTPGFVGAYDTQVQTVSAGVTAGQVARADLLYDTATWLSVTPGGAGTLPAGVPLTVRSAYVSGATLPDCAGVASVCRTGLPGTVRNLFPTQHELWAGSCRDARTAGSVVVVALDRAAVRGSTVTLPLASATLQVLVNGVPTSGRALYARHAPDSGGASFPSCPAGEQYTLPVSQAGGLSVLLPYGTWSFSTSPTFSGAVNATLSGTAVPVTLRVSS